MIGESLLHSQKDKVKQKMHMDMYIYQRQKEI
jgi:hypothetical protein